MPPTARADELRRRARHLREVAFAVENLSVMGLDRHAGDDTWRGSRPALCRSVLASNLRQLHTAADELRWTALSFEREADVLDAGARLAGSPDGSIVGPLARSVEGQAG